MMNLIKKSTGLVLSLLMAVTLIPAVSSAAQQPSADVKDSESVPGSRFSVQLPFTDVKSSDWFYNYVKEAYETGLINGFEDNTFRPDENMTYAQAVKLAACMNQKYTTGSVTLKNGSPDWYDSYVFYAKEQGIIDRNYDWNSPATRADYAEIFACALPDEALKEMNAVADGDIPDVGMSRPQAEEIYKLYRAGILTGVDNKKTFDPDSNIKRSHVSAILTRMMNESARKPLTPVSQSEDIILYELKTSEYYDPKPDTEKYCINSADELNLFFSIFSDALRDKELRPASDVPGDLFTLEEYLESDYSVFIQVREVGSGSVKMKLSSISLDEHGLSFIINSAHPQNQTADMAFWYFVAVIPNEQLTGVDTSDWKLPSEVFQSCIM